MTYLEAINEVLRRLREPTVATVDSSAYVELIGKFVNEAKREVEDSWNWTVLLSPVSVSATTATDVYELTGTNQRTRILDAYNVTSKADLVELPKMYVNRVTNQASTTGQPKYYSNSGVTAATGVLKVRLWPLPDAAYTLSFNCIIPQADLSTGSTVISVPTEPIVHGAYMRAISERGEDQGRLSEIQERLWMRSLADAISQDANRHEDEIVWHPI